MKKAGGLFFGADDLQLARQSRDDPAIRSAVGLAGSATCPNHSMPPAWPPYAINFNGEAESAAVAIQLIQSAELNTDLARARDGCKLLMGWLSVIAMLRQHQSWPALRDQFRTSYAAAIGNAPAADDPLDGLWLGALQLAVGVVFGDERALESGADAYRHAVHKVIHPEGYLARHRGHPGRG